jgi:hypothetical protein
MALGATLHLPSSIVPRQPSTSVDLDQGLADSRRTARFRTGREPSSEHAVGSTSC